MHIFIMAAWEAFGNFACQFDSLLFFHSLLAEWFANKNQAARKKEWAIFKIPYLPTSILACNKPIAMQGIFPYISHKNQPFM